MLFQCLEALVTAGLCVCRTLTGIFDVQDRSGLIPPCGYLMSRLPPFCHHPLVKAGLVVVHERSGLIPPWGKATCQVCMGLPLWLMLEGPRPALEKRSCYWKNCQAKVKSSQGQVKKKVKKKERRLDFADSIVTTPHHHPPH